MGLIDKVILHYIDRYSMKLPRCNNKILNYLRELDRDDLSDEKIIKNYWIMKLKHISLGLIIAFIFLVVFRDEGLGIYILSLGILSYSFIGFEKDIHNKVISRRNEITMEFPNFINKVILLLDTGMTLTAAWELACDPEVDKIFYYEVNKVMIKIKSGKAFNKALEEFAVDCRVAEVAKFTSILLQNYKKGGDNLIQILRIQGAEAWQMRKNVAFRMGNKGSTKLLFPMMMIFVAIMLLIITPALLQLKGIVN